jgi:hypothetical protein
MKFFPLLVVCAVLSVLAGGCTDRQASAEAQPAPVQAAPGATAPNIYNPYARDPLDPDLNPHYMRGRQH